MSETVNLTDLWLREKCVFKKRKLCKLNYLIESHIITGKEPAMNDKNLVHNQVPQWQRVKDFCEELKSQVRVLGLDFTFESIDFVHGNRLVISTGHVQRVWIQEFETEENQNALYRERAAVDKVSVEEVHVYWRREPILGKDVHEIVVLTVNISANSEARAFGNANVNKRRLSFKVSFSLAKELICVLFMEFTLSFEKVEEIFDEIEGDPSRIQMRSFVST